MRREKMSFMERVESFIVNILIWVGNRLQCDIFANMGYDIIKKIAKRHGFKGKNISLNGAYVECWRGPYY